MTFARQYSFPNVQFTQRIEDTIPLTANWRNTIGVVGEFNKGPLKAIVSSRQDILRLYGESDSIGADFVNRAMRQGATNFIISRVMPSASEARGFISLQSAPYPTVVEATVANDPERTDGLTLDLSFIGPVVTNPGEVLGVDITTDPTQRFGLENYTGVGRLTFTIQEKVTIDTPAEIKQTETISFGIQIPGKPFILSASVADDKSNSDFIRNRIPGEVIKDVSGTDDIDLTVVSYPYIDGENISIWLDGLVTDALPTDVNVHSADASYFIVSYNYSSPLSDPLPSDVILSRVYERAGTALGFLLFRTDTSVKPTVRFIVEGEPIILSPAVEPIPTYEYADTNITFNLESSDESGRESEFIPRSRFSVIFLNTSVSIGRFSTSTSVSVQPPSTIPQTLQTPFGTGILTPVNPPTGTPDQVRETVVSSFDPGLSATDILHMLSAAILEDSTMRFLIKDVEVNEAFLPRSLSMSTILESSAVNRIQYRLSRTHEGTAGTDDILFGEHGGLYDQWNVFVGGQDEMTYASLFLYAQNGVPLVYIRALSPGASGNNISVTVAPLRNGTFRLSVFSDFDVVTSGGTRSEWTENFILNNFNVDTETGLYQETLSSITIRAFFVPVAQSNGVVSNSIYSLVPYRLAPVLQTATEVSNVLHPSHQGASYLRNLRLAGGQEPVDYGNDRAPEEDYIQALSRLEEENVAILTVAGIEVNDVRYQNLVSEVIAQAERSTTFNGLRIAVLGVPRFLSGDLASRLTLSYSSSRLVLVGGWATIAASRSGVNGDSPVGPYVGFIAALPPHVSPAASTSAGSIVGIQNTEVRSDPNYLDTVTQAGIELLHRDPAVGFKWLNGLTTSSLSSDRWLSVRRQEDQMMMDLYAALQWVRSENHTKELRQKVSFTVDSYLEYSLTNGRIFNFQPTVCDQSNNTALDISQGKLNFTLLYVPNIPADYIYGEVVRSTGVTLNTAAR